MKHTLIPALFLLSSTALALDTGDGSDGNCTSATITQTASIYNCQTLTIDTSLTLDGSTNTNSLIIYVQGDVEISSSIDLSGGTGDAGTDVNAARNGGVPGVGGYAGGNVTDASSDGANGAGPANAFGIGGTFSATTDGFCDGPGGGGGIHQTNDGTAGRAGGSCDASGTAGTAGDSGTQAYGTTTPPTISGGAGGGAGGSTTSLLGAIADCSAGAGGGGGGAIHIRAGGRINVAGTINVDGGVGGAGATYSGGGGGGAGGLIYLEANDDITISGTLTAIGGAGGEGNQDSGQPASSDGDGGSGGSGIIYLESHQGTISNTGSIYPAPGISDNPTSSTNSSQLTSSVSCGTIATSKPKENLYSLFLGILSSLFIFQFLKRGRKIKSHL